MKLLQFRVSDEELKEIEKRIIELSTKEGKLLSMSAGLRVMIKEYLIRYEQQPSNKESQKISKESEQDSKQEGEQTNENSGWADILD